MEANNLLAPNGHKKCFFCKRLFKPYPTVKDRQYACPRKECQALRQRLNEIDWHRRNRANYDLWYQAYYKAWRQRHPDCQKRYRQRIKLMSDIAKAQLQRAKQRLLRYLKDFQVFQAARRKQLQEHEHRLIAAARTTRQAYAPG